MATLPPPPRPLPVPRRSELLALPAGTSLVRLYRIDPHGTRWDAFRTYGPAPRARFDHHVPPPGSAADRGILYVAGDAPTALVEAFAETRLIDRRDRRPWLVRFGTVRPVRLLDIGGTWPTRAGASQALATGDHPERTQAWARAIVDELDVDGIRYPSSQRGRPRERRPDAIPPRLWGANLALFERAADALPPRPSLHIALDHPGLATILGAVAVRYGYDLA
ncbi:MAG: RES family NAD+ phosphorylase [Chloroflexota bacterium]